ncbi:MAG: tRNA (cytidine(34)-2'-O)-methyltransferase [Anaerorhabdus sp.]
MINVVLYEPEIPQNTGNIMRTCMAANCRLHLIEPLGFSLDEKHLKRAGMDYLVDLSICRYTSWEDFISKNTGDYYFISRYGKKSPTEFDYSDSNREIFLIFGKESTGIPKEILKDNQKRCARLPMVKHARSLNLSNCVAICVYEVHRQQGYLDLSSVEILKGEDWLNK